MHEVLAVLHDPLTAGVFHEFRHQIFGAGEHEHVGFLRIEVLRQAFVGLAGNGGQREAPAEAKRPVAGAGIISEASCGPKPPRPGEVAIGTLIEPVPVTGLAANFSPMPRIAPPPLGREIEGADTPFSPSPRLVVSSAEAIS